MMTHGVWYSDLYPLILPGRNVLAFVDDAPDLFAVGDDFLQDVRPSHALSNALNVVSWKGTLERGIHLHLSHFAHLFTRLTLKLLGKVVDHNLQACSLRRVLRSFLGTSFLDRVDLSPRLPHDFPRHAFGLAPYIALRFMEFSLKCENLGSRGCLSVLHGTLAYIGFFIRELLAILTGQTATNLVGFLLCYCGTNLLHSAVEFYLIHSFRKRLTAYRTMLWHYSSSFY
jgi:hypothetical protein